MFDKPKRKRKMRSPRTYVFMGLLVGMFVTGALVAVLAVFLPATSNDLSQNIVVSTPPAEIPATLGAEFAPAPTVVANRLYSVASSPVSDEVAVVGWDNGANQLRLLSPSAEGTLNGDIISITIDSTEMYDTVHYSADGAYLAFASQSLNRIDIYDAQSRTFVNRIQGVYTLAYSPDNTSLAVAGSRGNILIFDPSGTQMRDTIELGHTVFALAYSPNSKTLAVAYYENGMSHVIIYDSESERYYPAFYTSGNHIYALDFHPAGGILAVATDNNVQVIYLNDGEQRFYPLEVLGRVRDVVFSPDGRHLVASGGETGGGMLGQIIVWTLPEGFKQGEALLQSGDGTSNFRHLTGHAHDVNSVLFTAHNRLLSASSDGTLRLWDIETGLEISRLQM
jgi:WD40 repeat protein